MPSDETGPRERRTELLIGVDIGGTKTACILGDAEGNTVDKISFATDHRGGPAAVLKRVCAEVTKLQEGRQVQAVGVSCGGPLDSAAGVVLGPPNLPGWDSVPVVRVLAEACGLPTRLENDANAGALAEWRFGAGRGCRNMIFITAGTGLGCGLIVDGRLYGGTNDMAGEAWHIRLAPLGPRGYGKSGSFEGFCSGGGIGRLAGMMLRDADRRGRQSCLFAPWLEEPLTAKAVAEAAHAGDALACEILHCAGSRLGEGLSVLIDVLNPEVIVLGSLAVRLGERYLGPAREVIGREALVRSAAVCRVVPAELGERAGEVAALCVALEAAAGG